MEYSFWDVFRFMYAYEPDFNHCWLQTVRSKRGIVDTSKPGGMARDQNYFDGFLRILEARKSIDFHALYAAKVSLETYWQVEPLLKRAVQSENYLMPPHLDGEKRLKSFL